VIGCGAQRPASINYAGRLLTREVGRIDVAELACRRCGLVRALTGASPQRIWTRRCPEAFRFFLAQYSLPRAKPFSLPGRHEGSFLKRRLSKTASRWAAVFMAVLWRPVTCTLWLHHLEMA